jgi:hypothetical protein
MGCLVTDRVEFPEETNFPPSIESSDAAAGETPPTDLGQVVQVNLDQWIADPGMPTVQPGVTFPVVVRDPNVDQTLEYKAFLDCPMRSTEVARGRLTPQGTDVVARPLEVRIEKDSLLAFPGQCCKFELLVSTSFDFFDVRGPEEPGDLGSAVWWIAITDSTHPSVDMTQCP